MTSDWDKESPDQAQQGWYAFQNYVEWLKSRGVTHTCAVVTKMKFDSNANYPKIFFAADRWCTPEELAIVNPLSKNEDVLALLTNTYTPAGADGVRTDAAKPAAAAVTPEPEVQIGGATDDDDDGDAEIVMVGLNAPAEKPVQEPAQAKVATPTPAKTKAAAAKAAVAATVAEPATTVDASLGDLLADWGGN